MRLSTIGAEDFDGRVRDGIGYRLLAIATRSAKNGREANRANGVNELAEQVRGSPSEAMSFVRHRRAHPHAPMGIDVMRAFKPNERLVPVS